MTTATATAPADLRALIGAPDLIPLAACLARSHGLAAMPAAYAAAVAECATHAVWEGAGGSTPYAQWLATVPEAVIAAAVDLAVAAARDGHEVALRHLACTRAVLDAIATQLGH
ncbi:hypothetical protein [Kitasatospora sp. NPDC092286]|uniref:hypothetical protein n=1 Tax=Kitasatospora sp. NPDC092286 TaxID=3364087 RepID=UPI0038138D90